MEVQAEMRSSRGRDEFCSRNEKQRGFGGEDAIGDVGPQEWSKGGFGVGGILVRDTRPKAVVWGGRGWRCSGEREAGVLNAVLGCLAWLLIWPHLGSLCQQLHTWLGFAEWFCFPGAHQLPSLRQAGGLPTLCRSSCCLL